MRFLSYGKLIMSATIIFHLTHDPFNNHEYHTHQETYLQPPICAERMVTNMTSSNNPYTIESNIIINRSGFSI